MTGFGPPYNICGVAPVTAIQRPTGERGRIERGRMKGKHSKPRTEHLVSAGGVVYRRVDGNIEAVLCGRHLAPQPSDNPGVRSPDASTGLVRWSLAKGTPDPGETLEETALREVREETGLEVEISAPIDSIEYWFAERGKNVRFHKTVHFYLMVPRGGDTNQHDPEFDVVQWFPYDQALDAVGYPNEAGVLRKALDLINQPAETP